MLTRRSSRQGNHPDKGIILTGQGWHTHPLCTAWETSFVGHQLTLQQPGQLYAAAAEKELSNVGSSFK